jgi:uncharacterized protein DUF6985
LGSIVNPEHVSMFGLFKSPPFRDPQLGELVRSRGHWRGSLTLEGRARVPLALSGTRAAPDAQAMAVARAVATQFASWRPSIEQALFEHYSPYAEALAAGAFPPPRATFPRITAPSQVWLHVSLAFVSITPFAGVLMTELGYTTAWDEEHTLGVRFQSDKLIALCGSVFPP